MGLDLVLGEVWDVVEEDEGEGSAEVDNLVHGEGHYAGCEDIVSHVGVPGGPCALEDVEVGVVKRNILKVVGVGDRRGGEC